MKKSIDIDFSDFFYKHYLKCPATCVTGIGFLVCVVKHMLVVGLLKGKRFSTEVTGVWCLT